MTDPISGRTGNVQSWIRILDHFSTSLSIAAAFYRFISISRTVTAHFFMKLSEIIASSERINPLRVYFGSNLADTSI